MCRGIKIDAVDYALEQGIRISNGPQKGCEQLSDLVRERADDGPNRVLGIFWLNREIKANEFLIVFYELKRLGS